MDFWEVVRAWFTLTNISALLLTLFILTGLVTFYKIQSSKEYENFNCIDLITTKDKHIDRPALMEFSVFVVMTWGFVIMVMRDKIQEWYVAMYVGAFVFRALHSAYLKSKIPTDQPVDTKGVDHAITVTPAKDTK